MQRDDFLKVRLERDVNVLAKYEEVSYAYNSFYLVKNFETGLYGLIRVINGYLEEVIPCCYQEYELKSWIDKQREEVNTSNYGLRRIYKKDALCGYHNPDGELVIPLLYEKALPFAEDLACVRKGEFWGYIYLDGHVAIPFMYERAKSFNEELAPVKINDKWGFINKKNKFVISPMYDFAESFRNGWALVRLDGKYLFIDKENKPLTMQTLETKFIRREEEIPNDTIRMEILEYFSIIDLDDRKIIVNENNYNHYLQAIMNVEMASLIDHNHDLINSKKLLKK